MTSLDPYRRAGLARNPFCHDVVGATTLDRGVGPVPQPGAGAFVQLVGEKGAGKSSLLAQWRAHEPGPYHWVPPTARRWRPLPVAPIVYWDELDRAPLVLVRRALRRSAARGGTVVAGTHADLSDLATRAGFTVRTHQFAPLTAADVSEWSRRCVEAVALVPGECPVRLEPARAAEVAAASGGSWRRAGDLLHAWIAVEVA